MIDDIRENFSKKLEQAKKEHAIRLSEEIRQLQVDLLRRPASSIDNILSGQVSGIHTSVSPEKSNALLQPLFHLAGSNALSEMDKVFIHEFRLVEFYPADQLLMPTIFCESLEEFFKPFISGMNYSEQARRIEIERLMREAVEMAEQHQGGIFGVNFPGQGCYINGWLLAKLANVDMGVASQNPLALPGVMATVAHEKLGHGFISAYSTLGKLKSDLGFYLAQIAARFNLAPADDAETQLRVQQNAVLYRSSHFLEEGWSTWIENWFIKTQGNTESPDRYSLQALVSAIQEIPKNVNERDRAIETSLRALEILFSDQPVMIEEVLQAVKYLAYFGDSLDDHFKCTMNQPLKYVLGYLICAQCEANLGQLCVPYAMLIAANITFDFNRISFSDLSGLLSSDPRLNPDTRLAAISRIRLREVNDVREMACRINAELSLSIPPALR